MVFCETQRVGITDMVHCHCRAKSTSNIKKSNSGIVQGTRASLNWANKAIKNKFNLFLTALCSYPKPFLQPFHTHVDDKTIFCHSSPSSPAHTATKDLFTLSQGHIINVLPLIWAASLLIVTDKNENHCICASCFSSCQIFFQAN